MVDGPRVMANGETRVAGRRPIHANSNGYHQSVYRKEIRFLEYRLEVIESWPDSGRKSALQTSVLLRIHSLEANR